jgi:hypothetical protein
MSEKDPSRPNRPDFWNTVALLGALVIGAEILLDK